MNTIFARGTRAQLFLTLPDGTSSRIDFSDLRELSYETGFGRQDVATFSGVIISTSVEAAQPKDKPAKAPKKPTLQASARAARKATVKHAQLTKRIFAAEQALITLKNQKAATDTELKTAREAVLAAI